MKRLRQVVSLLLVIVILLTLSINGEVLCANSKMPGFNAKPTRTNVMKILNRYDKDGEYILKKMIYKGDDIMFWFYGGSIIDNIDTAIHEEAHGYLFSYAPDFNKMAYFVGNKKTVNVSKTQVYLSKEMASSIPKRCRTFRYKTYVAKPDKNLSSNVDGAYGLLNEMMAYRLGMSNTIKLFPYYKSKNAKFDQWRVFINGCENNKLAYLEFKYYILHYLYYAKYHYPQVYRGIIGNSQFCKAYRLIEGSFAKHIKVYKDDLKKIKKFLEKKGDNVKITDDFFYVNGVGTGRYTKDYSTLKKEISKKKYNSIHKAIVARGK